MTTMKMCEERGTEYLPMDELPDLTEKYEVYLKWQYFTDQPKSRSESKITVKFKYKTKPHINIKKMLWCIVSINGTMHTSWRWDVVSLKFCSTTWHGLDSKTK